MFNKVTLAASGLIQHVKLQTFLRNHWQRANLHSCMSTFLDGDIFIILRGSVIIRIHTQGVRENFKICHESCHITLSKFRILENIFANMGVLGRALVRAFVKEYYHIKYN
jgi:hypothetical protein